MLASHNQLYIYIYICTFVLVNVLFCKLCHSPGTALHLRFRALAQRLKKQVKLVWLLQQIRFYLMFAFVNTIVLLQDFWSVGFNVGGQWRLFSNVICRRAGREGAGHRKHTLWVLPVFRNKKKSRRGVSQEKITICTVQVTAVHNTHNARQIFEQKERSVIL